MIDRNKRIKFKEENNISVLIYIDGDRKIYADDMWDTNMALTKIDMFLLKHIINKAIQRKHEILFGC